MNDADGTDRTAYPAGAVPLFPAGTLWTVQVMRGVAALMIVAGHSQGAVATIVVSAGGHFVRSTLVPWGAGVDLFFVISGFIMIHASARLFGQDNARREFLRRRLVRIVPLYWLVSTAFLGLLAVATLKGGDPFPAPLAILASYAFVPTDTYGDGRLFPVFDLGWTLNYEMFFYALLALVVVWPRRRALGVLGAMLALLIVVGALVPGPSAIWFWTRPIIGDFGLGLLVGVLVSARIVLPDPLRAMLAAAGMAALLVDPFHIFNGAAGTTVANAWPRVMVAGVPVAIMLAAALLGREPPMPRLASPFTHIGDASYSLYLFHPVALIALEKFAQKASVVAAAPGWVLVAGTVAAAIAIALGAYRWIERPMTAALGRLTAPRRLAAPPVLAAD